MGDKGFAFFAFVLFLYGKNLAAHLVGVWDACFVFFVIVCDAEEGSDKGPEMLFEINQGFLVEHIADFSDGFVFLFLHADFPNFMD